MVVDLKVPVRSLSCDNRACYVGNPRESFFRIRERECFIRESPAKVGYYESFSLYTLQLVQGYHLLPPGGPGSGRRMVPHIYLSLHS